MPRLQNQGGQMIVEAVLIIVILLGVTFATSSIFRNQELVKGLIQGPWQNLSGMLENGLWGTPDKTAPLHPNGHGRHIVITGDPVL